MSTVSGSFATQAVPEVRSFLRANGLLELESRFDWAPDAHTLYSIGSEDPTLSGVSQDLRSRFLAAVARATGAAAAATPGTHGADDYENREAMRLAAVTRGTGAAAAANAPGTHAADDYENQEAIRLATAMSGMGPGGSMGATAELEATQTAQDEDEVMHQYQNQETIELHTIDAHQTWMHGNLDRQTSEARLRTGQNQSGRFLVRMKGATGRLFAFSILLDAAKGTIKHSLIQFRDDGTVLIDNKPLSRPCNSLKSVVRVLIGLNRSKLRPSGAEPTGLTDFLLHELQENEARWKRLTCSRSEAEHLLSTQQPGVFFIREASKGGLCFSVRLAGNKMYNGAIVQTLEGYQVGKTLLHAPTLPELARAMMVDFSAVRKCGVGVRLQLSNIGTGS